MYSCGMEGCFLGIIKNTIKKIKKLGSKNKIIACIGPCIGKKKLRGRFQIL